MMRDLVIYKVDPFTRPGANLDGGKISTISFRAVPQPLQPLDQGPRAAAIFQNTTSGANPGNYVEKWLSPTRVSTVRYGITAENPGKPLSDMINSEGEIGIIYSYSGGKWTLEAFQKLTDSN
jgi:hypothetical protein